MVVPNINKDGVLWNKIRELYGVGPRFYHTFDHALDVLRRVDKIQNTIGFMDYQAARLAALFHDAVYIVGDPNNEHNSAKALMDTAYDNFDEIWGNPVPPESNLAIGQLLDRASDLIRATARHATHQRYFTDWDTVLFLDCDMMGFADEGEIFQHNNISIDREFASSPLFDAEKYAADRLKFLTMMYHKGIFRSPYVKAMGEGRAITNLGGYLVDLGVDRDSL